MGFNHILRYLSLLSDGLPYSRQLVRIRRVDDLGGCRVAIDANLYIHSMKDRGADLAQCLDAWCGSLKRARIEPLFVFDGMRRRLSDQHPARSARLDAAVDRTMRRSVAAIERNRAVTVVPSSRAPDWLEVPEFLRNVSRPVPDNGGVWSEVKQVLDRHHLAWMRAGSDADSLLTQLADPTTAIVDFVASEGATCA